MLCQLTVSDRALKCIAELLRDKKFQEAFDICSRAIEENPQNAEAHFKMAWVQQRLGNIDLVKKEFAKALQLQTRPIEIAGSHYYRGEFFLKQKDWKSAVADFTACMEFEQKENSIWYHSSALFSRADAYLSLEQYQKALDDLLCIEGDMLLYNSKGKREKSAMIAEARAGVARRNKKYDLTPKD